MIDNYYWDMARLDPVSDEDYDEAVKRGQAMDQHRQDAPSRRTLKENNNLWAYLAEQQTHRYLKEIWELPSIWDKEQKLTAKGDTQDIICNGWKIDVKARITDKQMFDQRIMDFEFILDEPTEGHGHQLDKEMDYYIFCLVNPTPRRVIISGFSNKEAFKADGRYVPKGEVIWQPKIRFPSDARPIKEPARANEPIWLCQARFLHKLADLALILKQKKV